MVLGKEWTRVSVVQLEREDLRKWVSFDASWNTLKPNRSRTNKRSQRSAIAKSTQERSVKSVRGPSQLRNHVDGRRKPVRQKGKESLHSCSNRCYIREMMITSNVFIIPREAHSTNSFNLWSKPSVLFISTLIKRKSTSHLHGQSA